MSDLYNWIEELGKRHGYANMSRLCKAAGVSRTTMSELRKGRSKNISKKTAEKFANCLSISIGEVYGEQKQPTQKDELSDDERELIVAFRNFSDEGKKKVLDYVSDLQNTGIYKNDSQSRMVAGE